MFQDLILAYWVNPVDPSDKTDFVRYGACFDILSNSRYYVPPSAVNVGHKRQQLYLIDTTEDINYFIKDWWSRVRYPDPDKAPTVYFGFQGGPGWTLPEFHDILNITQRVPMSFPGVAPVSWLPDNWFDHPGLTPTLHDGEHALEWLEQQVTPEQIPQIEYNFQGGMTYERAEEAPPF